MKTRVTTMVKIFIRKHKNLAYILYYSFFVFFLYRLSVITIRGTGQSKTIICASWLTVIFFFVFSNKSLKWWIGFPIVLIACLYAPVAAKYGPPNYYLLGSLLGTDSQEIKDYISIIELRDYLISIKIITYFVVTILISRMKYLFKIQWMNKLPRTNYQAIIIALLIIVVPPLDFFHNVYNAYNELNVMSNKMLPQDWQITSVSPKYKDYVLVIGESARRDYMHLYGYPIPNTPFFDSIEKEVLSNITASDFNTISSLTKTLNLIDKNNRNYKYGQHIISLAKSAGFETFWLSNQGRNGLYDTPVSKIAIESEHVIFLKNGTFDDTPFSDSDLLPFFKSYIEQSPTVPYRLFVLHLMGSHIDPCSRVINYSKKLHFEHNKHNKQIECYINSIKQTDELLGELYNILQNNKEHSGRSFSMFYISDHALSYDKHKKVFTYEPNRIKQYEIPFVKISSDTQKNTIYTSRKSAIYFFEEFAHWIGVKSKLFEDMTLFSDKIYTDIVIDGITANDKEDDKALDLSK